VENGVGMDVMVDLKLKPIVIIILMVWLAGI